MDGKKSRERFGIKFNEKTLLKIRERGTVLFDIFRSSDIIN